MSENVLDQIIHRLRRASSILVVTHARPDGDCLGSASALAQSANLAGKAARVLVPDKVPQRYDFLFGPSRPLGSESFDQAAGEADVVVIVDTCAFGQLDGLEAALKRLADKIVVIDHHATCDPIGVVRWIDTSAAAAGVLVAEIIDALGWPLDGCNLRGFDEAGAGNSASPAEALAVAITSDTGWLRFANTDARCLRVMAGLLDKGIRPDVLYARLYQCDRIERLRLAGRMLAGLELHCDGRLAVMTIRREDFAAAGARQDETENLVNEALRIGTVESAVLLTETDGPVRASLRSRDRIDVAAIAGLFGGGGHARAAGVRSQETIDVFKQRLVEAFTAAFGKLA